MPNDYITTIKGLNPSFDQKKLTVVILGATVNINMKSYGPKLLLEIKKDVTIVDNILRVVKNNFKNCDIILTTGYMTKKVLREVSNVRIVENQLFQETGNAEEIRLAINNSIDKNILFINGDLIIEESILKDINLGEPSLIVTTNLPQRGIGVITNEKGFVNSLTFTEKEKKFSNIFYLENEYLDTMLNLCSKEQNKKMFSYELINIMIRRGFKFKSILNTTSGISRIDKSKELKYL